VPDISAVYYTLDALVTADRNRKTTASLFMCFGQVPAEGCARHGTLAFDVADDVRDRVFRRDADAQMDMIPHRMTRDDLRLPMPGLPMEDFSETLAKRPEEVLFAPLRDEHNRVLTAHLV
jgi:hypothetical protein